MFACVPAQILSRAELFTTPWTVTSQALLSKQEYWSGLPFPPPGDLPDPGIEPASPGPPALAGEFLPLCHLTFYRKIVRIGESGSAARYKGIVQKYIYMFQISIPK